MAETGWSGSCLVTERLPAALAGTPTDVTRLGDLILHGVTKSVKIEFLVVFAKG